MPRILAFDESPAGLSWILDEPMQRASHALVSDGRVWLVDPVDVPEAMARVATLGEPAGVVQLLDRHNRDCAAVAERLGVAHLRLPGALAGSPFSVVQVLKVPRWHELALWNEHSRTLVVSEAVGSGPFFRGGDAPAGIHMFLRLRPPGALRDFAPEHLLFGHGPGLHGPEAADALRTAYRRSVRDLPGTLARIPGAFRGQ
jgi:hypothetical protein